MTVMDGEVFTNEPSTYGLINYGENLYGVTSVPAQIQTVVAKWVVEPFTAQSLNYGAVGVSWSRPQGTALRWRLISNRYGYPVDQNDGNILIDSPDWIGTFFLDTAVVPGAYQYYGIYAEIASNTWLRAGVTACLATENAGTAGWLADHLPAFITQNLGGSLTQDAADNSYLEQFLQVLGWGVDYVQAQYNMLFNHLNDPMAIPIGDLMNLATELGMPFDPMISVYLMRKAAANWSHVAQERGTMLGIENQLSLLTGFGVDLQIGPNLTLEQDQSQFIDPAYPQYNSNTSYHVGEIVAFGSYLYSCLIAGTVNNSPSGVATSTANWQLVQDGIEPTGLLTNPNTGGINTWEVLYPAQFSNVGPAGSLVEGIGEPGVSALTTWQSNTLKLINKEGSTQDMMLRSVSRLTSQITSGLQIGPIINNNWDFETGVSSWSPFDSATLSQSTLWANTGAASLLMVGNGSTANPQAVSEKHPVVPLAWYLVSGHVMSPQGYASGTTVGMNWFDNTGTYITTTNTPNTALTANTPVFLAVWVQAPANAMSAQLVFGAAGTPANTVQFLLDTCIWQAGNSAPDPAQPVNDGIPVPFTLPNQVWNSTVRYGTGAIVTYNGQPFVALRASTGATPPFSSSATSEWAPLSPNSRLPLIVSGQASQNLTTGATQGVPITPFVEWYDQWGNLIERVTARTTQTAAPFGAGTTAIPSNLALDSFVLNPGNSISGRSFDNAYANIWNAQDNNFIISTYNGGVAYPSSTARSVAIVTTPANGQVGVTFVSFASGSQHQGLFFRWSGETNYWKATPTALIKNVAGAFTTVATYSTAANPGDRLVVQMSGSLITVLLNGAVVATATDSFNSTATLAGMLVE